MVKIVKTVVSTDRSLIGLVLQGKERELGGLSNDTVEQAVTIENLLKNGKFNNNQLSIVNNKMIEKGNFKLNNLPMMMYDGNGYIEMGNSINLVHRFVQNNENVGFTVAFEDGAQINLRYSNIINISKWFKPGNFVIKTSAKNNEYICSKKGCVRLDDMPSTIIGEEPKVLAKRTKSAAKEKEKSFSNKLESGIDLLDIYDFVDSVNGVVIKMPNEKYEAVTINSNDAVDGFTSLGIGEVGTSKLEFNSSKLNVSSDFKKVGFVPVNIGGNNVNITTYVHRKKVLFFNGENHLKSICVAIPTEAESNFVKSLGASLVISKVTDLTVIQPLSQVIDSNNLVYYTVDVSKVDLISKKKRASSILSNSQIKELCTRLYTLKLISKYTGPMGGVMKNLKGTLTTEQMEDVTNKKVKGLFSMMNTDALAALTEAGIDIYSGAYTPASKSSYSKSKTADTDVEIDYILEGMDYNKLSGSKIKAIYDEGRENELPAEVVKVVRAIESTSNNVDAYKLAFEAYKKAEREADKINRVLWMHKASMFIEGGKTRVHTHDRKFWTPDIKSRVKAGEVFLCTAKDAEGLTIKVKNVTM